VPIAGARLRSQHRLGRFGGLGRGIGLAARAWGIGITARRTSIARWLAGSVAGRLARLCAAGIEGHSMKFQRPAGSQEPSLGNFYEAASAAGEQYPTEGEQIQTMNAPRLPVHGNPPNTRPIDRTEKRNG
jgi:hypothetical protein